MIKMTDFVNEKCENKTYLSISFRIDINNVVPSMVVPYKRRNIHSEYINCMQLPGSSKALPKTGFYLRQM